MGNYKPIRTKALATTSYGKGMTSVVPLRSPLVTASAAEIRGFPKNDLRG